MAAETGTSVPGLVGRGAECEALDRLLAEALAGHSQVSVVRGEAGVGKSALLGYLSGKVGGWCVARAVGVESEMELAYSGLHQVCAPMLDHLEQLPVPQREALATVFGRRQGPRAIARCGRRRRRKRSSPRRPPLPARARARDGPRTEYKDHIPRTWRPSVRIHVRISTLTVAGAPSVSWCARGPSSEAA